MQIYQKFQDGLYMLKTFLLIYPNQSDEDPDDFFKLFIYIIM